MMAIATRSQQDLVLAERLVSAVEGEPGDVRKIYGGLCHSFPVLVRACGLCQALAFSAAKAAEAGGSRARAHRLLVAHVAEILGIPGQDPLARVRATGALEYLQDTRRLLAAWIYFKRFAVSVLGVSGPEEDRGEPPGG